MKVLSKKDWECVADAVLYFQKGGRTKKQVKMMSTQRNVTAELNSNRHPRKAVYTRGLCEFRWLYWTSSRIYCLCSELTLCETFPLPILSGKQQWRPAKARTFHFCRASKFLERRGMSLSFLSGRGGQSRTPWRLNTGRNEPSSNHSEQILRLNYYQCPV